MALKKEGPEFDHDDEVLLLEPGIMLDESSADEQPSPRATPKVWGGDCFDTCQKRDG